jgi:hypothetical protein
MLGLPAILMEYQTTPSGQQVLSILAMLSRAAAWSWRGETDRIACSSLLLLRCAGA